MRAGSDEEASVVSEAAEKVGAAFRAVSISVEPGPNLEARARAARYAALPADCLTGHTADDQAETILLNIMRGAGLDGLSGIRPGEQRPLLGLRRSETELLCKEMGFSPVVDPTNQDPAFRRNRVRHELMPMLNEIAERDVVEVMARQARLLRGDADLLNELSAEVDPTSAASLTNAPLPLARRAIRTWLSLPENGGDAERHPLDAASVDRVLGVASNETVACEVSGGRRVRRSQGRMMVELVNVPLRDA